METNFNDDQFNYDPTQYADQGANILPEPGEYTLRVTSKKRKEKDGEPVLQKGIFPVLTLQRVEIVEPEDGGTHGLFYDVRTSPFLRKMTANSKAAVSPMTDLLRAIDVNLATDVESFETSIDNVEAELNNGATFRAKLGYKALDIDRAKAQLVGVDADDNDAVRQVWNSNTYYTKAFRRQDGKGYNTTVVNPDGKILEAKLTIDSFVSSNKQGKLGPF